jgi:hypothetical protein
MCRKRKWLHLLRTLAISGALATGPAASSPQFMASNAANWRLQNYVSDSVAVYFTGSDSYSAVCVSGKLLLPSTASTTDRNRWYQTIALAKVTGATLFVYFETTDCTVQSFGLLEQ